MDDGILRNASDAEENGGEKLNTGKRKPVRLHSLKTDTLIMLSAPTIMAWYYHGLRVFAVILIAVVSAAVLELLFAFINKLSKKEEKLTADIVGASTTGIITALMMSAASPLWLAPLGLAFAYIINRLLLVKIFRSRLREFRFRLSEPALAVVFSTVIFSKKLFDYYATSRGLTSLDPRKASSVAAMLQKGDIGALSSVNFTNLFVGNMPGAMGCVCFLVLIAALFYLILRHPGLSAAPVAMLAVCVIAAVAFPRITFGRGYSVLLEASSGMLMFACVFLLSSPPVLPRKIPAAALSGAICGILTVIFRRIGLFEESACFAVILVNLLTPVFNGSFSKRRPDSTKPTRFFRIPQKAKTDEEYLDDMV